MRLNPVRVLIVDDTLEIRQSLPRALGEDAGIEVLRVASNAKEAEELVRKAAPDIVVLKAGQDDGETGKLMKQIDPAGSLPFILVGRQQPVSAKMMRKGPVEFVKLPRSRNKNDFSAFCNEVCVKIKISAQPLLRHGAAALAPRSAAVRNYRIIAIGASTGGTEATAEIIKRLPGNLPGIVIVQHMPPGFTKMYAERLNTIGRLRVAEARDGDRVEEGTALVAAGAKHMVVKKDRDGYYVKCIDGQRINGHCPSVGVLFDSVAEVAGKEAIGVILTGMGKDGAEGLLRMRKAGAFTIGQDRESSVVYGMPMVAQEIGAVMRQASCRDIADIIAGQFK